LARWPPTKPVAPVIAIFMVAPCAAWLWCRLPACAIQMQAGRLQHKPRSSDPARHERGHAVGEAEVGEGGGEAVVAEAEEFARDDGADVEDQELDGQPRGPEEGDEAADGA